MENGRRAKIADICSHLQYGTSSKSKPQGKIPVLRMGNLQGGEIDWTDLVYTDDDKEIEKLRLRPLDVLFNRTNSLEHVGKAAIYRGEQPAIFAGYLIRLHYLPEVVDPEFLTLFLNSKSVREYGRTISGKSVNQANISAAKLQGYSIVLPSLAKQREVVARVESMRQPVGDIATVYEQKIQDIDELRRSLLQKAFAGGLTRIRESAYAA
nr:restriction endonuclease subunit S [Rhizobium sp. BK060]